MKDVELKVDADPKDNYGKAFKLLYETDQAIQILTMQERDKLIRSFLNYKGMSSLYQEMQQYFLR